MQNALPDEAEDAGTSLLRHHGAELQHAVSLQLLWDGACSGLGKGVGGLGTELGEGFVAPGAEPSGPPARSGLRQAQFRVKIKIYR